MGTFFKGEESRVKFEIGCGFMYFIGCHLLKRTL